ncbi:glycosyltransferase family 2 protein [Marinomonas ostreistagni]|uniref:Glycosyltransferase family 2 protein n=1 Tax=Marinomonas ostreistagni TaxID=359209 RepID=A0ABS0Z6C9_9GAMM|nr:glycosyltransferase family 2 protein [Marinomonas ostreistagni]MBJ7549205.1 glycosyltransferase family 2 protein [Marinomonas ostreistagni]
MRHISIITINYNSAEDTLKMVESIRKVSTECHEIVVVDNNSSLEDFEKLSPLHNQENVRIVRSRINLGFSGGNMLGVEHAAPDAEHYLFLNNDTTLLTDIPEELWQVCNSNPTVGLVSAQQYDEHQNLVSSFGNFPNIAERTLGKSFARWLKKGIRHNSKKTYDETISVEVVSGAAMFFKRECFEAIGGFDTHFFLYCEEEDISRRTWLAGYEVQFRSNSKLVHYCGKSTERNMKIEREFIISYFRLLDKHFGLPKRTVLKTLFALKYLKKAIKNKQNTPLLWFVLQTNKAPFSLRHQQAISPK